MMFNLNFKSGLLLGALLGIVILTFGYFTFKNITSKANDIANINLQQIEYVDLEGNPLHLTDFKGKHIFLNFWATWCAPCIKEFPLLDKTYEKVHEDFVFIMVSDESINKIESFVKDKPYQFIYAKSNNLILNGITSLPQTYILDKNGVKRYHHSTIFDDDPETISIKLYDWLNKEP